MNNNQKVLSLIEFCLKAAFALIFIFCLAFTLLNYALVSPSAEAGEFTLEYGNFGLNPLWLSDPTYDTMNEIYALIGTNHSVLDAAYLMYVEALKKLALSKYNSYRSLGTISFEAAGLKGEVLNTIIRSNKRVGQATLNPNHPTEFYYQNIVTAQNIDAVATIKGIIESAINKGMREYSDGVDITREFGSNSIFIDETGGGAKWSGKRETKTLVEDGKGGRQYNDPNELREISNLIITPESILEETVKIEQVAEMRSDGTQGYYYNISFNLNCNDPTSPSSAVYYEAESIRKQVGESLLKTLAYTEASLSLKIYDTGYLTDWSMTNTWNAIFKVLFDIEGSAAMSSRQVISYKEEDCKINQFTLEAA